MKRLTFFYEKLSSINSQENWGVFNCAEINAVAILAATHPEFEVEHLKEVVFLGFATRQGYEFMRMCKNCMKWIDTNGKIKTEFYPETKTKQPLDIYSTEDFPYLVRKKPIPVLTLTNSVVPVVQRHVKVGLFEGSLGFDHIGVGVNTGNITGFSPKVGFDQDAEAGSWVDGEVKEDRGLIDSLVINTNSRQDVKIQDSINRSISSPPMFNLYQHNCAHQGAEMLKSGGLNVESAQIPRTFFAGLKSQFGGERSKEEPVQMKHRQSISSGGSIEPDLESAIQGARSGGQPLSDGVRQPMERAFGADFGGVRVHTGDQADRLNRSLQARAFTTGQDIFLRQGEFRPGSSEGQKLLAHELTHVVQQNGGAVQQEQMQATGRILQAKEEAPQNKTGMPDHLKSGLESLSGMDLSAVRVHYSSPKPAQLNALAYTQGQEIHVAPGQERHLPHEGWHAVQQMQGRVRPTMKLKDGVPVNDDEGLEHEADVMGERAFTSGQELIAHELTHVVQQNVGAVMRSPLPNQQLPQHPTRERPSASVSDRVIQANGLEVYAAKAGKKKLEGPITPSRGEHAEPKILRKYTEGDLYIEMNAWPCTDIGYDCHEKLQTASSGRTITVVVTGDQGGYSANHEKTSGSTGTITYTNGVVSIVDD